MSVSIQAQIDSAEVYRQLFGDDDVFEETDEPEKEKAEDQLLNNYVADDDEEDKGKIAIFVSLQPAVYLANNFFNPYNNMANYYNGSIKELVLDDEYVINNIWHGSAETKRIIKEDENLTDAQYNSVFFSDENNSFNYNMTYDIGLLIGFQAFFAFKPRLAVLLGFNFVNLKTASQITYEIDEVSGTPNQITHKLNVYGKEQRFITELGLHYIYGKRRAKGYIDVGFNFLMAKAEMNEFSTGDDDAHYWSLMRTTNNTAANTITSFTFGGYGGLGLFFKMNDNFAFELGPQVSFNNIDFRNYSDYFMTTQINLRIIYLSKNSEM